MRTLFLLSLLWPWRCSTLHAAGDLCVTSGAVERDGERFSIDAPSVRAVSGGPGARRAELRFRYLGPTGETRALASGELRRQVGLKLRARDGCNVVYAMWRVAPSEAIVVSVKRNLLEATSDDCENRGYRTVATLRPPSPLVKGARRSLSLEQTRDRLQLRVDGAELWSGRLPLGDRLFDGPAGLRTDNVRLEGELWHDGGGRCHQGDASGTSSSSRAR